MSTVDKGALLADEMGLGKTIQAIAVINAVPKIHRVLVICPQKLKLNWYREMRKWLVRDLSVGIADSDCFPTTDIVIINYDVLHKWTNKLSFYWDLLIGDEVHYLKNRNARRTQAVIGYKPRKDEDPSKASSGIPARRKLMMTGTPICNKREEVWPIANYLAPDVFGNWWKFNRVWTEVQVQEALRGNIMIRRLKKDVLKELPPKRRQIVPLPPDDLAKQIIAREQSAIKEWEERLVQIEAEVELAKAGENLDAYQAAVKRLRESATASFTEMSKIRHETALAKLPSAQAYIEDMLMETDKLVVLAYHRDVIEKLHTAFLGVGALRIYGGMSPTESQRAVDLFQNDDNYKLIILQIHIAVGMTLTEASNVVGVELDWVPGNMSQAEDRCHRIGQRDSVNVYHLVLEDSLDQKMAQTLVDKQNMIDRTLDNPATHMEAAEPMTAVSHQRVRTTRADIEAQAKDFSTDRILAVHTALKHVSAMCNHARTWDAAGFSKVDSRIGHELADRKFITPKQAVIALALVKKYRRQLNESILKSCGL